MKFVLIFGPQAVGKMTVGHELEKITELKLLHNHMTIEPLYAIFGEAEETWRLSGLFRQHIFEAAAKSSNLYGLIFTFVWNFNSTEDLEYVEKACDIFESRDGEVYFIELEADLHVRHARNETPHRLEHKPTKRNIEQSENRLIRSMELHRLNSKEGEITRENYLRINNTNLSAEEVARIIKNKFEL